MIEAYGMSHVGQVRSNNEDSYATEPDLDFYVVADGMGGAQAGERASHMTVSTLVEEIGRAGEQADLHALVNAAKLANRNVRREAAEHLEFAGMGTTLVAAIVREAKARIINVGDSRAYLQSGKDLYCVTSDHSWVNEVGRGLGLSEEQLRVHPYRNILTKAIGAEEEIDVQELEIDFLPGDLLLLCSDGLHGVAGEPALGEVLEGSGSLQQKCEALIEAALERGAPDNITAVLIGNMDPRSPDIDETID